MAPAPLSTADVADALGVKSVPAPDEFAVFHRAAQLAIGNVLPPLAIVAGTVNVRFTFAPACPVTENAAADASVTATVLFNPGKTAPNARSFVFVTESGCWTLAVTLALADACAAAEATGSMTAMATSLTAAIPLAFGRVMPNDVIPVRAGRSVRILASAVYWEELRDLRVGRH
jgi:hypothetical protein